MTLNSETGLISWTQGNEYLNYSVLVKVLVSDGNKSIDATFYVNVKAPNNTPMIKTIPDQSVTAGSQFQYYVSTTDKDNDRLTYSLNDTAIALGMKIDANFGLITWSPTKDQIRNDAYFVTVYVTDSRGEPIAQTFNVKVVKDTQAPNVSITATPPKTTAGQTVTITVKATDNVGVQLTTLKLLTIKKTEYDGDGRSILNEQLIGLIIEIDANGQSFLKSFGIVLSSSSTIYNTAGWIISSLDTNNLETQYIYNVYGETTQTRRELSNNGGWMVSETVYDSQGRVIFSTDSPLEGSTDPIYGTETRYNAQGRSIGSVRYKGCSITIDADGNAAVVSKGTVLYTTSTEYDSKGRTKSSTDAYGNITTYEYDNQDRQVILKQVNGLVTETVYDS
jgi:YD repeat-containing protein